MSKITYVNLSKTIAHALRHAPERYGLILDEKGWVSIDRLIEGLKNHSRMFKNVSIHDLEEIIKESPKKRFEIKNGKIRAIYGHSVRYRIEQQPKMPPKFLYHGTTPKAAENILRMALKPMGRQYVHLSIDVESAYTVGRRRTKNPTILKVFAQESYKAGIKFYEENDGIWLSDAIPAEFIEKL